MSPAVPTSQRRVAAVQCALGGPTAANVARLSDLVAQAAAAGAQIVLTPELPAGPYFCKVEDEAHFAAAAPAADHPLVRHFAALAARLQVVLPVSFFERDGPHYYNSMAMVDADGSVLGVYRKAHIPDGPGYEEKYYFRPGNTPFRAWQTRHGRLGVGICWDQWFPECARAMMLDGAELLLYPTAIGSEPGAPELDTCAPWQRAMVGHAVSNVVPVVAANRIGDEAGQLFYGSSFIADAQGDLVATLGRQEEGVIHHSFDAAEVATRRAAFGFFRDRRPALYGPLVDA